jgi:hypothetical protein
LGVFYFKYKEINLEQFLGFHSEWNLCSPGGWDYQRLAQIIGKAVWDKLFRGCHIGVDLGFDHSLLNPLDGFVNMLKEAYRSREGTNPGLIAVVAEEETLQDVVENKNLAARLSIEEGLSGVLIAPHELELKNGRVYWQGTLVALIFMDFSTNVLVNLHRKYDLAPILNAIKEGRIINPRGTEPINIKSIFEVITDPRHRKRFHKETIRRTPWTRQFYPRRTLGPKGEQIPDLVEWTRSNWEYLVLKPERGYSGKGVRVGGIHQDINEILNLALKNGNHGDYIVQEKIPLQLWSETMPELDLENQSIREVQNQTDFRCLFGNNGLFGFLGRYGKVPTNVGSGGGMQPLAVLKTEINIGEATKRINEAILNMDYGDVLEAVEIQKKMAIDLQFTYLLGPIKIALRPRLVTIDQMKALKRYCANIWSDCLTLEKMWSAGEIDLIINIEPRELEIIASQPWKGSPAIFASDGLFSFGAHVK